MLGRADMELFRVHGVPVLREGDRDRLGQHVGVMDVNRDPTWLCRSHPHTEGAKGVGEGVGVALPVRDGLPVQHLHGDHVTDFADLDLVESRDEYLLVDDDREPVEGTEMPPRLLVDPAQPANLPDPAGNDVSERAGCPQAPSDQ